jgi:hypothetical protein
MQLVRLVLAAIGILIAIASCGPAPTPSPFGVEAARAELRDLIGDVTAATAHRYRLTDDLGRATYQEES